jgi:hypothetical protein
VVYVCILLILLLTTEILSKCATVLKITVGTVSKSIKKLRHAALFQLIFVSQILMYGPLRMADRISQSKYAFIQSNKIQYIIIIIIITVTTITDHIQSVT